MTATSGAGGRRVASRSSRRGVRASSLRLLLVVGIIVLFVCTGVAGASVAILRATPLYQSSSTLLFSPVLSSGNGLAAFSSVNYISSRVNAYVVVARSQTFQDSVRMSLRDTRSSPLQFAVSGRADQLLLDVSATTTDPKRAVAAVDAFARQLVSEVDVLDGFRAGSTGLRADIVTGPTNPQQAIAPNRGAYYAVGVGGGCLLAAALVADSRLVFARRRYRAA